MSLSAWSVWIVNCRSSFLGLLLAMLVQIWAVLSVTAMRFPGRTEGGGRSISRITRLPASTSCQGFGMPCLDLGLSDSSLRSLRSSCFSLGSQLRALGLLSMTLHGCSAADAPFHVDSTDDVCTGGLSRTFCLRRIRRKVVGPQIVSDCARKDPPFGSRSEASFHLTDCVGPCGFGLWHVRWSVASPMPEARCKLRFDVAGFTSQLTALLLVPKPQDPPMELRPRPHSHTALVKACAANARSTKLPTPRFGFPFFRGNETCS